MTSIVDVHAKDISLESVQEELRLHPLRLEERRERRQVFDDEIGNTPLLSAVKAGNISVVQYLLSLGANVDSRNKVDILMFSCESY